MFDNAAPSPPGDGTKPQEDTTLTTPTTRADRADSPDLTAALVGLPLHQCCAHHARTWAETMGGLLPPSEHSPGCKNYHQERFALLDYDGAICVVEWDARLEYLAEDEPPSVSEIMMTRDQYERMEDFQGP
jgi:hypothetical protein